MSHAFRENAAGMTYKQCDCARPDAMKFTSRILQGLVACRGLVVAREGSWLSRLSLLRFRIGGLLIVAGFAENVGPYFSSSESSVISRVSARSARRTQLSAI
jgi:hypothetical protein